MNKMTGESKDIVAERIEQLKALMPEAFAADGKIDFDALKGALGEAVDSSKEHYRFIWNGKEAARAFALRPSMGTLRPCAAESSGKDGTAGKFDSDNLYIEGDNLEVLKLLQGSYHNAVKMIYIDPPYNTGHDFVYADNFSDSIKNYKEQTGQADGEGRATHANAETSGRYHTDWLNMMFPRLLLARNLLRDDGVIFISIDDNEVTNLRKLCDEVFGEANFVAQIVVQTNPRGRTFDRFISKTHEYVLIYVKDIGLEGVNAMPKSDEAIAGYSKEDEHGKYRLLELRNRNPVFNRQNRPLMFYPLYADPDTLEVSMEKSDKYAVEIYPRNSAGEDGCWTWGVPKATANVGLLVANHASTGKWSVFRKDYLEGDSLVTKAKSLWLEKEMNHENGKEELGILFGQTPFDFPKSVDLIKKCVMLGCEKDDMVIDFFSGSATTAQAVSEMNSEDGGTRKSILIQVPEKCDKDVFKNICEIGKERIRRAGKKIKEELERKNEEVRNRAEGELLLEDIGAERGGRGEAALPDIGFKVFKLDTSNIIPWNPNPEDLEASLLSVVNNVVEGRAVDDLLYEILLKCNLPLTLPIEKKTVGANTINVVGKGELMICLDKKITASVAEEMVRLRDEVYKSEEAMQVVFLDNGFTDKEKANAIAALVQAGVEEKAILSI